MKILFVIAALKNGGAERVLQVLVNHFCAELEVCVAVLQDDEKLYKFDERVKFLYLNVYKSNLKFAKYRILRQTFKEQNPDLIISFIDWTNVACVIANFGLNYKLICTEHNSHEFLKSKIFTFVRNLCYKRADFLSVLTHSDLKYYKKFVKNAEVVYNPFFGEISNENFKKENSVISVGRLEKVKGYEIYFKALSLMDKTLLKQYKIYVAGDGSERENLQNSAKNLGLNVIFLGHQKNISEFYKKSKIFVISSFSEGLSNVLIESAFYKCARISSDTVGAKELIKDEKNGLLFKIGDAKELAKKLEILMKDENLQKKLIENADESLVNFMPGKILKQWEKIIETVVNK